MDSLKNLDGFWCNELWIKRLHYMAPSRMLPCVQFFQVYPINSHNNLEVNCIHYTFFSLQLRKLFHYQFFWLNSHICYIQMERSVVHYRWMILWKFFTRDLTYYFSLSVWSRSRPSSLNDSFFCKLYKPFTFPFFENSVDQTFCQGALDMYWVRVSITNWCPLKCFIFKIYSKKYVSESTAWSRFLK